MLLTENELRQLVRESIKNIIREGQDYCAFYDYLDEYSPGYIFQMYDDKERLFNLINPSMYKQALSEFMKYGEFVKFPTRYIYQWMAIIMANTAKIHSITAIAGHSEWGAEDEFIDHYFMGDSDLWDEYKQEHYSKTYDDYDCMCEYLDNNGFYDWTKLPDGSDAWSDYGLQPLAEICQEYNENMSPEEVIVLINRALDVTHQRGDLASAFIVGGSKTLSEISNGNNITESEIMKKIINENFKVDIFNGERKIFNHVDFWNMIEKDIKENGYTYINIPMDGGGVLKVKLSIYETTGGIIVKCPFFKTVAKNISQALTVISLEAHNLNKQFKRYRNNNE